MTVLHHVDAQTLEDATREIEQAAAALERGSRLLVEAANLALTRIQGIAQLSRYEPITLAQAHERLLTGDCVQLVAGWFLHQRTGVRWPAPTRLVRITTNGDGDGAA